MPAPALAAAGSVSSPFIPVCLLFSSGVFSGSAVCVYSMAAVRAAFNGPFAHKEGFDYRWVEYKGRIPYPRPGTVSVQHWGSWEVTGSQKGEGKGQATLCFPSLFHLLLLPPQCPSETYDPLLQSTKDFPDDVISFMRTHQLMWEPIYPLRHKPILVKVNVPYRLRQLLVHRLETENRHYDILFLGTGRGFVACTLGPMNTLPVKGLGGISCYTAGVPQPGEHPCWCQENIAIQFHAVLSH